MRLAKLMAALVSAVAVLAVVLAVGVALPLLAFGDGTGLYEGQEENYAELVLLYDAELREWPFPIDPTVASRVENLERHLGPDGVCYSEDGLGRRSPFYTGYFARGDYTADAVHYGPFFVPTGKNVIECGDSRTVRFLEPSPGSPLSGPFGLVLLGWVLLCVLSVTALPLVLLAGGARLWRWGRSGGGVERLVGLAALAEGAAIVLAVLVLGVLLPILT